MSSTVRIREPMPARKTQPASTEDFVVTCECGEYCVCRRGGVGNPTVKPVDECRDLVRLAKTASIFAYLLLAGVKPSTAALALLSAC